MRISGSQIRIDRRQRASVRLSLIVACSAVVLVLPAASAKAADLPRDVALLIQEGNDLLSKDRAKEALEVFDKAKARAPDSAEIAFNRGVALYRIGEFDKAQSAFQDSLKPERPDLEARAKYNLARTAHASALARKDDPQNSVNDLTRAVGFYNDTLALKPDDADAKQNLDLARRMQAFLQKRLEQQKQEEQPSSQPGDKDDNSTSQPSDEKQQGDQSSKSDQEKGDEEQQQDSDSSESESDPSSDSQNQNATSQPNDEKEQQEPEDENDDNNNEQSEADEQPQDDSNDNQQQNQEKEQEGQATSQPEDQATTQPSATSTSQPTSMPSGQPLNMNEISQEQANRLLQEARDSERLRRQKLREQMMRRQGRVTVDKDW